MTGRVTDDAGKPIAGARVRTKFTNEIREARTGDDGTYRLVGCEDSSHPPIGFHVADAERPRSIVLAGSHRFARYELTLLIEPDGPGSCGCSRDRRRHR